MPLQQRFQRLRSAKVHPELLAGPAPGSHAAPPLPAVGCASRKCSVAMARVRRRARPCGAWRSAGLTDRWTGSGPQREAEGKARTSGACGGRGGWAPGREEIGPREEGTGSPGREEIGSRGERRPEGRLN